MGFSYLNGNNWLDVTREERSFCAHLYWDIKGNEKKFISWLNTKHMGLNTECEWEIAYEVCFYRDLLKAKGMPVNPTEYSAKRTFDLCLLSEDAIIIIEVKAQQPFYKSQVVTFQKDKGDIKSITNKDIDVYVIALASSRYFENYNKHGKNDLLSNFDKKITWEDMHLLFNNSIYIAASEKYKH